MGAAQQDDDLGNNPDSRLLYGLITPAGMLRTLNDAIGQFWYAMIATWGIGAVALVLVTRWSWSQLRAIRAGDRRLSTVDDPVDWARNFIIMLAFAASIGVAMLSSAALPDDDRITYHAYPRYIGFLFPIWLMVGIWTLWRVDWRERAARLRLLAAGLLLFITGYLIATNVSGRFEKENFLAFDVPEASFLSAGWN